MGWRDSLGDLSRLAAQQAAETLMGFAKSSGGPSQADDRAERTPGGSAPDTTQSAPLPTEPAVDDPKTLMWDPFALIEQMGYKDRPSSMTFGTIRGVMARLPPVKAIVQTRVNQVAAFANPQHSRYQLGFRVKTRDTEGSASPADRKFIKGMETQLLRTGVTDNPRGRDDFETFLKKLTADSLMFDQMCFEVVPNRKGQPAEWYAVDATTMRLAQQTSTHHEEDDNEATKYVQIYESMIVSEYNQEELAFGIRNPSTDIRLHGYGTSEVEMLVNCITSMLWAWDYNSKFFTQGSAAKGLLNFKGVLPAKQMKAFQRHWYQMLSGVENAWRTPILNAGEGVEWVNMQQSNKDMEFNAWMDFLLKVACSVFIIDPVEINFKYGNTGQSGGLNEGGNKEKITESKERGLRPLLRSIASLINKHIIWPINEGFEFDFVGLDAITQDQMADLNMKRVKTTHTINEIRAEDDKPPLPDDMGDIILDPTYIQYLGMKQQAAQQKEQAAQMAAQGGPPGANDDEEDGDQPNFQKLLESEASGEKQKPSFGGPPKPKALTGVTPANPKPAAAGGGKPNPFAKSQTAERRLVIDLTI